MALVEGRILLAAIANGRLAVTIGQEASLCESVRAIEDESFSDDEEFDLHAIRRRAKKNAHAAVTNNCLPADARPLKPTPPLASIAVLQEAIELLEKIVSQPAKPAVPTTSTKSMCLEVPQVADEPQGADFCAAPPRPTKATSARSSTSRPTSRAVPRAAAARTVEAAPREDRRSGVPPKTQQGDSLASSRRSTAIATQHSPKPPKPTKNRRSSMAAQPALFFCMHANDDTALGHATSIKARDSSLARGYNTLDAVHFAMEDDSDADTCGAQGRESSTTRAYEALDDKFCKTSSKPASPDVLPPVSPPCKKTQRRGGTFRPPSPPAASAMELDLGLRSEVASGPAESRKLRTPKSPEHARQSRSLGGVRVGTPFSKQAPGVTLPSLPPLKTAGGISSKGQASVKMRTGSVGAVSLGVPPMIPAMELDTRCLVF